MNRPALTVIHATLTIQGAQGVRAGQEMSRWGKLRLRALQPLER
jgi:hypothetical protein